MPLLWPIRTTWLSRQSNCCCSHCVALPSAEGSLFRRRVMFLKQFICTTKKLTPKQWYFLGVAHFSLWIWHFWSFLFIWVTVQPHPQMLVILVEYTRMVICCSLTILKVHWHVFTVRNKMSLLSKKRMKYNCYSTLQPTSMKYQVVFLQTKSYMDRPSQPKYHTLSLPKNCPTLFKN
jgi:hypothetical protein